MDVGDLMRPSRDLCMPNEGYDGERPPLCYLGRDVSSLYTQNVADAFLAPDGRVLMLNPGIPFDVIVSIVDAEG